MSDNCCSHEEHGLDGDCRSPEQSKYDHFEDPQLLKYAVLEREEDREQILSAWKSSTGLSWFPSRAVFCSKLEEAVHYMDVMQHFGMYEPYTRSVIMHEFQQLQAQPQKHFDFLSSCAIYKDRCKAALGGVHKNADFFSEILSVQDEFYDPYIDHQLVSKELLGSIQGDKMSKVRSVLRQLCRDWAVEGKAERDACYQPIIKAVEECFPVASSDIKIQTPGSGQGRLPFELAQRGYASEGNEVSYYMLLPAYFVLNCMKERNLYTVLPNVMDSTNWRAAADRLYAVQIPDVSPVFEKKNTSFGMSACDFLDYYRRCPGQYDCIITCFFLDTANNVQEYLDVIGACLKPGGVWINFGPLQYHFSDVSNELSLDQTWEEVQQYSEKLGFIFDTVEQKQSGYTSQWKSMQQYKYECIFSIAKLRDNRKDQKKE